MTVRLLLAGASGQFGQRVPHHLIYSLGEKALGDHQISSWRQVSCVAQYPLEV